MDIKLKLKIKDVELEFSKDEIIELKNLLDELFPNKEFLPYTPYYPPVHYTWWEWKQPDNSQIYPIITYSSGNCP